MLKELISFVNLELTARGIPESSVPTIILAIVVMSWSVFTIVSFRLKIKCSDVSCGRIKDTMVQVDAVMEKLESIKKSISSIEDKDEIESLRGQIDSMHHEISRLSGLIYGNNLSSNTYQRKVIRHD